jgi:hypothetical protein
MTIFGKDLERIEKKLTNDREPRNDELCALCGVSTSNPA